MSHDSPGIHPESHVPRASPLQPGQEPHRHQPRPLPAQHHTHPQHALSSHTAPTPLPLSQPHPHPPQHGATFYDPVASRPGTNSPLSAATSGHNALGKPQTVFIHKLFDMLEDHSLLHLIWWSPSQDSFCLYPGEEFSNALSQYFKHTNIASFIRQLNMYGFHKVNDNFQSEDKSSLDHAQQTKWEFRHLANQFRKGDVDSLSLIKRKSSKLSNSHKEIVNLKSLPPTSDAPVDELKSPIDSPSHEQYHLSVYQQLWNQFSEPGAKPLSKDLPRHPGYPPAMISHHYPMYTHGVPHSPGSPPFPDQPVSSPSYFLQLPQLQKQPLQPQLRQTSVPTPALPVDLSINLKLIEMNTSINNLKSQYLDLATRYDSLFQMHQRGQADLLQLTEIVDKLLGKTHDAEPKRDADPVDRSKTHTPVNRTVAAAEQATSPHSVRLNKSSDLSTFKNQLKRKVSNPSSTGLHPAQKSSAYHLSDGPLASKGPASHIVPQHYPLNPNYTLFPDGAYRHIAHNAEELSHAASTGSRHVSVLMDPLQPCPSRNFTSAAKGGPDDKHKDARGSLDRVQNDTTAPATPGAPGPTPIGSTPMYAQPYQPVPPTHFFQQHVLYEPNLVRTTSLPASLKPISLQLGGAPQRHSLNTIVSPPSATSEAARVASPPVAPAKSVPSSVKTEDLQLAPIKKLPSMHELNMSIRSGSPSGSALSVPFESDAEEERAKKRKLD